jgi:hypothetical protein
MHDPRRGAASGALGKITKIPGLGNLGNMPDICAIVAHSSSNPALGVYSPKFQTCQSGMIKLTTGRCR